MRANINLNHGDCMEAMAKASETRLIKGDCLEFLKSSDSNCYDLIITSPPYNLGHINRKQGDHLITYNTYSDDLKQKDYNEWQIEFLNECYRVLKNTGLIYYNHKQRHKDGQFFHPLFLFEKSYFKILQSIIWNRCSGTCFNIGRYVNSHENLIVGYKTKDYMRITPSAEKNFDVWTIPPNADKKHPASFPIELPTRILNGFDNTNMNVLDPFGGSGTTALACQRSGINVTSVEMDEEYYNLSIKRLEDDASQLDMFIEQPKIIKKTF